MRLFDQGISKTLAVMRREIEKFALPIVTRVANEGRDPFKVLISCILSLRTKDETTAGASRRLFSFADSADKILSVSAKKIEKAIYPVGFYRVKAKNIKRIAKILVDRFKGKVPADLDTLLTLPGVGRKTANLVLTLGFNRLGICVDTHVHRISNRLGYLRTMTPEETEFTLRKHLPKRHWIEYNDLLVTWGQNICKPVSPLCSACKVNNFCAKVGVGYSR